MEHVWLAAALQPYEGMMVVGKKEVPAVSVCVAEGLKVSLAFKLFSGAAHQDLKWSSSGRTGRVDAWDTLVMYCSSGMDLC